MPVLDAKLADLSRHADAIDTLFIGSSRMANQLDPTAVDAAAAAGGCFFHSYNLGVPNLNSLEYRYLVERARELNLPHLRHVFMDLPLNPVIRLDHVSDDRTRFSMTPSNVRIALGDLWALPHSFAGRLWLTLKLLVAFLYEQSGTGRIAAALLPTTGDRNGAAEVARIDFARRGFMPLFTDGLPDAARERREAFVVNRMPAFERRLEHLRTEDMPAARLSTAWLERLHGLVDEIRSLAPSVGLVMMPSPLAGNVAEVRALESTWPTVAPDIPVLNFNRPHSMPEFAAARLWFDDAHLQEGAARGLSAKIGAELCQAVRNAPGAVAEHGADARAAVP